MKVETKNVKVRVKTRNVKVKMKHWADKMVNLQMSANNMLTCMMMMMMNHDMMMIKMIMMMMMIRLMMTIMKGNKSEPADLSKQYAHLQ